MVLTNVIAIADELFDRYGVHAALVAERRAQRNFSAGDKEAAALWHQVCRALEAMQGGNPGSGRAWKLLLRSQRTFDSTPHPYLLLAPNLEIVGANDLYLAATMTARRDILGCNLFDVFPDNPDNPGSDGVASLGASLARVLDRGVSDRMSRQRYDIRRPDGAFEERWWKPQNLPVFEDDGKLSFVLHHVEDVTATC